MGRWGAAAASNKRLLYLRVIYECLYITHGCVRVCVVMPYNRCRSCLQIAILIWRQVVVARLHKQKQ